MPDDAKGSRRPPDRRKQKSATRQDRRGGKGIPRARTHTTAPPPSDNGPPLEGTVNGPGAVARPHSPARATTEPEPARGEKLDLRHRSVRDTVAVVLAVRHRAREMWFAQACLRSCRRECDVEAEDLLENALTLFLRKGPRRLCTYDEACQWMIATIYNLARDRRKFERKMKAAEDADLPAVGDVDDAEWQALLILFRDEIGPALETLPERQYNVIVGLYIDGLSATEVAEKYGISKETVRTHFRRARKALKKILVRFGP